MARRSLDTQRWKSCTRSRKCSAKGRRRRSSLYGSAESTATQAQEAEESDESEGEEKQTKATLGQQIQELCEIEQALMISDEELAEEQSE